MSPPHGEAPVHHLPFIVPPNQQRMSRADLTSNPLQRSKQLLQKVRRAKTDHEYDIAPFERPSFIPFPEKIYEDTDQLRTAVFNTIRKRLQQRKIDTSQLTEAALAWCLPKSIKQQDTWKLLLNNPIQTPADLVNTLLVLKPATPDTKPEQEQFIAEDALNKPITQMTPPELMAALTGPKPSTADAKSSFGPVYSYYIRTFRIQVRRLRRVLTELVDDGFGSIPQITLWLAATEDLPLYDHVDLRYCGQSKNRPWSRHVQDIYSSTETRFIVRFFRRVASYCPDVLANATVQSVTRITTKLKLLPKDVDFQEMALIALFGDGTLNVEAGGKDSMVLTEKDHATYLDLGRTNLVHLLRHEVQPCSSTVAQGIYKYTKAVRKYVEENKSTTGRYEFTDETEATIIRQAMPSMLTGSPTTAVLVTLGSDFGELEDSRIFPFFEGTSRSAVAVSDCYNHFAMWEQPLGTAIDHQLTKTLARAHTLPFVDLFPWFVKASKDYLAARKLLNEYMMVAKPLIVLTLGEMQTFAMNTPIESFSLKSFHKSRRNTEAVEENLGVPQISSYDGSKDGSETVIIPCFHPGYLSHIGILKDKAQALLVMVLAIGWQAASLVITISQSNRALSRKVVCNMVIMAINAKLQPQNAFGKALRTAKRDFIIARTAYYDGRLLRDKAPPLAPVPTGILPAVQEHVRQGRVVAGTKIEGGIGGFEVSVLSEMVAGPKQDNVRVTLRWTDDNDGKIWVLSPILIPTGVTPSNKKEKRFIYLVPGGIDIRNSAGDSLGARKPITSGNTKTETLPISSIILSMSERENLPEFVAHWQKATGVDLHDLWRGRGAGASSWTESFFPASFFTGSAERHALPFTNKSLKPDAYSFHLEKLRGTLPANTGDLLWLVDRFLAENFPSGGEVDLAAGSEVRGSVYHVISRFCSQQKYKHHPHLRTFCALASIVEQGADERMIATNALVYAFQVLRAPFEKKAKTLKYVVDGQQKQTKRFVVILGQNTPKNIICNWIEPDELECEARIVEDVYDDEDADATTSSDEDAVEAHAASASYARKRSTGSSSSSPLKRTRQHDVDDDHVDADDRLKSRRKISRTITHGGHRGK